MLENVYTLEMEFLTPVHVGTGEELDPFRYVLEPPPSNSLRLVDFNRFLTDHADDKEILKVIEEYSFGKQRSFFQEKLLNAPDYALATIPVTSKRFTDKFREQISKRIATHQLLVSLLPRSIADPKHAFIPGSSIKGAVRTAAGNAHTKEAGVSPQDASGMKYNEKIFGRISHDVFKRLKISDASLPQDGAMLVSPVAVSLNPDKPQSHPNNLIEATRSLAMGGEMKAQAKLVLDASATLNGPKAMRRLDMKSLFTWLNNFYLPKFDEEMRRFYSMRHLSQVRKKLESVVEKIEEIKKAPNKTALVRIGRFSHVECVTYDHVRQPKGRMINGVNIFGRTRTLAEEFVPFGWVMLRVRPGHTPVESAENTPAATFDDVKKASDPTELRTARLNSFKQRLEACSPPNRPGSFPGIAGDVQNALEDDPVFAAQAAKAMLDFIKDAKQTGKFKKKEWFNALRHIADD